MEIRVLLQEEGTRRIILVRLVLLGLGVGTPLGLRVRLEVAGMSRFIDELAVYASNETETETERKRDGNGMECVVGMYGVVRCVLCCNLYSSIPRWLK